MEQSISEIQTSLNQKSDRNDSGSNQNDYTVAIKSFSVESQNIEYSIKIEDTVEKTHFEIVNSDSVSEETHSVPIKHGLFNKESIVGIPDYKFVRAWACTFAYGDLLKLRQEMPHSDLTDIEFYAQRVFDQYQDLRKSSHRPIYDRIVMLASLVKQQAHMLISTRASTAAPLRYIYPKHLNVDSIGGGEGKTF